jgi:sigma-E factor negative regulatory protein RseC
MDPQGTVVEIIRDGRGCRAIVDVEAAAVCARCASGRGCGAGILTARQGVRRLDVAVQESGDLAAGDIVSVELAPGRVLRAALLVYGWPLAGAAVGAAFAYAFALADAGAAASALGGLAVGVVAGRRRLRDESCLEAFTPTLSRRGAPGR